MDADAAFALDLRGVTKAYHRQAVLQRLDLQVRQGECLGLVGINGAGKTTLIKCLLDFCHLDSGSVHLFGIDHRRSEARARLAFLPERFIPPYFMSGWDFLHYMAQLHGVPRDPAELRRILAGVDLPVAMLDKPVRALSKGTAQKLGLVSVLAADKAFYVLDEPMSGLDPKARALLKAYLLERRSPGQTLLFTSHVLSDLAALCDRLAVLHRGTIVYCGTPAGLADRYGAATLEEAYLRCVAD
ncbi:MAG: ABC transporter ATP-binding protein [Gammaproteobacteria bacterium]